MKIYTIKTKYGKNGKLKWVVIGLLWLLLWQIACTCVGNNLILPGPLGTIKALGALAGTGEFYRDVFMTIYRCLVSVLISFALGSALAFSSYRIVIIRNILALPIAFFKAVPVMAIVIYVLLLISSGNVPILVCCLMCLPVVYTNILGGLDSMETRLLEMADVFNLQNYKIMKFIIVPSILPHIKNSVSLIAGLSWKAVVAAEVLSVPRFSLGYSLMNAKYYLETENLFAYIVVIVLLSMTFEKLTKLILSAIGDKRYAGSKVAKCVQKSEKSFNNNLKSRNVICEKIGKKYNNETVLKDFNQVFASNTVTTIMAPSGSGKTTLLRILAGLTDYEGQVRGIEKESISMLFQEDRLIPWLNIYDNLAIVLNGYSKIDLDQKIYSMIKDLKLDGNAWKLPSELSGGMRNRVAMGRAFIFPSEVMLIDEPFRGLDEELKAELIDGVWKEKTMGKTVIVVTHNMDDAKKIGDKIIRI